MTLLVRMCDDGNLDMEKELIVEGADVNDKDGVSYLLVNNIIFGNIVMFSNFAGWNDSIINCL